METSKERVMTTFKFEEPEQVPIWHGLSNLFIEKAIKELNVADEEGMRVRLGDDFRRVYAKYDIPEIELPEGVDSQTIFGVNRTGYEYGQPVSHPLSKATLSDVNAYNWPDPACVDVSGICDTIKGWNDQYAILGGDWSSFWHDAIDLLGMENLYMKMYDEPETVDALMTHLVDFYIGSNQRIFDEAADLIDIAFIGNDFGSQTGPLIGPDMFDRFLLPHLKRLIDQGHDYGLKVQLHSCGGFVELIPSLIDAGLDAVQAVQTTCIGMDLHELKEAFGKKLVFNGGIDSHHTLISGTTEKVISDTREVLKIMMPEGGFVAGASHDWVLPDTPIENMVAMADTVREFGKYN